MMPMSLTTISDLRFKTKAVLAKALKEPVVVLHRAIPKGVILSMADYEDLTSTLEDYYLSLRAEEYEKEKKNSVDWMMEKELRKRLKAE